MNSPLLRGCVAVLLLAAHSVSAQRPVMKIEGSESSNVTLQKLSVDVTINGTLAITTWTMTFKNTSKRVLEGELTFPLGDGIEVSRYALDINGKLREAVPVEKAKGALVFESIERRRVDPGLLEKLEGNSFRTRIYPFNPGSTRTILIGYEEQLAFDGKGALKYKLPLGIDKRIAHFDIRLRVLQSSSVPILEENMDGTLRFEKTDEEYVISKHFTDYTPNRTLTIGLPKQKNTAEILMQEKDNKYYYLVNSFIDAPGLERTLPHQLSIAWDVSYSGTGRNINKELALLTDYLALIGDAQVNLVCFSNTIVSNQQFLVTGGNAKGLIQALRKKTYDGATNLSAIDFQKLPGEEVLLFSDGLNTFYSDDLYVGKKRVHCISSSSSTNFPSLHFISSKSGGTLVDLTSRTKDEGLHLLRYQPLHFLGTRTSEGISESYPSIPVATGKSFTLTGVSSSPEGAITLLFGYNGLPSIEKTVNLNYDRQEVRGLDISRIWAAKKINELNIRYDQNKEEISRLGKRYSIVTRNSSLIVLETVNDYITYGIEPPAELQEQYYAIMKQRGVRHVEQRDPLQDAEAWMKQLFSWYDHSAPGPVKPAGSASVQQRAASSQQTDLNGSGAISGKVNDENNEPMVGAIVQVYKNGIERGGGQTDIDGNYNISPLQPGPDYELKIRYASYREVRVTGVIVSPDRRTNQNIRMELSTTQLNEVVVREYRVPLIKRDDPGTTQTFTSEQIEKLSSRNTNDMAALAGGTYQSRSGADVQIAGARTTGTLYIVDGVQVTGTSESRSSRKRRQRKAEKNGIAVQAIDAESGANISAGEWFGEGQVLNDTSTDDYLTMIRRTERDQQYKLYLMLRKKHARPTFFFRVAGYFYKTGRKDLGLRVLSNLAELGMEDYELYKMLGYKLREEGEHKEAVYCFKKVVNWRPSEPQSYRDYGLALQDAGYYQRAFDTLFTALTFNYPQELRNMYKGYEEVLLTEINQIIHKHGDKIRTDVLPQKFVRPLAMDVRVVLNWNMNDTDIDLFVTDPEGEKCYYAIPSTPMGGKLTNDCRQGFGPEQFQVRKAKKGLYSVQVNYHSDRVQKVAGPTTLLAEIYTNYGTPDQERQLITLQLDKTAARTMYVAEFEF